MHIERYHDSIEDWLKATPNNSGVAQQSIAQHKQLAVNGWREGLERVRKQLFNVMDVLNSELSPSVMTYDTTGLDFDMGLVTDGTPEHWYDFNTEERKIVRVLFNPSASMSTSIEAFANRGAMLAAVSDCIECAGHSAEIHMVYGNTMETHTTARILVKVKGANEHLDLDRLAYLTVNIQCLRTLWFSYLVTGCKIGKSCMYHLQDIDRANFDVTVDRLDDGMSHDAIPGWVMGQLEKVGIRIR